MRYSLLILLLLFCSNTFGQNATNSDYYFSDQGALSGLSKYDKLIIVGEFSECGEWGGHKETITIFRDSLYNISASLIVDSVSCTDSMGNIDVRRFVYLNKTVKVSKIQQQEVVDCISEMTQLLLINKDFISNAFHIYSVKLNDQLMLKYSDFPSQWQGFNELRNSLFEKQN